MCDCVVFFPLTCDNMAIWTASWVGTLLVYRQSNTLVGWQAEGLAGGCCPQEGVALNLAPPYSVKQGVCSLGEERESKKKKKNRKKGKESWDRFCVISSSNVSYIKLDTHSLIRPFYINTENEAFSHVNTQITVAEGTIKPRTSGLFLSHTHEHRLSLKHTY